MNMKDVFKFLAGIERQLDDEVEITIHLTRSVISDEDHMLVVDAYFRNIDFTARRSYTERELMGIRNPEVYTAHFIELANKRYKEALEESNNGRE